VLAFVYPVTLAAATLVIRRLNRLIPAVIGRSRKYGSLRESA